MNQFNQGITVLAVCVLIIFFLTKHAGYDTTKDNSFLNVNYEVEDEQNNR